MSEPVQTCRVCGAVEVVKPDGRGFPPQIAKNRLVKRCKAAGHKCDPQYTAGWVVRPHHLPSPDPSTGVLGRGTGVPGE